MTELHLRPYQSECIDAVFQAWSEGMKRPAVVLPTGAGKTVVFAHLIKDFRMRAPYRDRSTGEVRGAPGTRVMVLVHRDELADQAIAKIKAVAPDLNVGKVKASQNEITADVMVCSVQTLASRKRRNDLLLLTRTHGDVGLIITDECHHGSAPTYQKIYAAFPDALQLGVTATLARGDGVGLGDVWEEVIYSKSVLWMISKGYLTDVKARRIELDGLDMGGIKKSRGDYQAGALGEAMEGIHADEMIARAYTEYAGSRPGVVFTPTVATAEGAAEKLNKAGVTAEVISGETPREERLGIFRRFREGETQVLANCMVLTEGFDAPWASCAVIARPTQSNPLYVQMVGRVLRPWPGKTDALVLDLVGASGSSKLCTLVDLDPTFYGDVKDGETLAEAVEREDEAAEAAGVHAEPGSLRFEMRTRGADLFSGSKAAWSVTPKGVAFIGCGDTTVFLWPTKESTWTVCTVTKGASAWSMTEHQGLDLSMAMAWGEATAEDLGSFSTAKSARWRKSPPSDAQLALAARLGLDVTGLNRGEVSAAIDLRIGAGRFDKHVGRVYC